jgi:hypothetical protein
VIKAECESLPLGDREGLRDIIWRHEWLGPVLKS